MYNLFKSYNFATVEDFFKAIGNNSIDINKIYQLIMLKISDKLQLNDNLDDKNPKKDKPNSSRNFDNFKNYKFNFFDCCNPLPGDSIFGIIETQNIISVHNISCYKYKKLLQLRPSEILQLDWEMFNGNKFQANLHILAEDRENLTSEILNKLIYEHNIQITSISYDVNNLIFECFVGFMLNYNDFISEIIASIETISNIQNVSRYGLASNQKTKKMRTV
jgi:GTP pyrophosphokinase